MKPAAPLPISPSGFTANLRRDSLRRLAALLATAALLLTVAASSIAEPAVPSVSTAPGILLRTPEELDELLAPIALYPDVLVALILPAATMPADLASAATFLRANTDPAQIAAQTWDNAVKSLAHYPDVVTWMNENLSWTQQTGDAFSVQPADVMKSIQQLRARAIAAGSLATTPQQAVITDGGEIRIVPAQTDVIYVPRYDPDFVYEEQPAFRGPWLSFGMGFAAGAWLDYDLNWDNYGIWVGAWHPGFDYRRPGWRHPIGGSPVIGHPWQPLPGRRPIRFAGANRPRPEIARPHPFAGAPVRPITALRPSAAPNVRAINPTINQRPNPRGYPSANENRAPVMRPSPAPAPPGAFGNYDRGSDARAASQRGQMSRQGATPAAPRMNNAPAPREQPQSRGQQPPSNSSQPQEKKKP